MAESQMEVGIILHGLFWRYGFKKYFISAGALLL